MIDFKGFKNRQCQLDMPKPDNYKHQSLKKARLKEPFISKTATVYNPLLFRDDGHYIMEDRNKTRALIRYVKELLSD